MDNFTRYRRVWCHKSRTTLGCRWIWYLLNIRYKVCLETFNINPNSLKLQSNLRDMIDGIHKIVFLARSLLKIREVCSENNSNQPAKQVMRRHEETVVWTRIRRNYKCSVLLKAVHSMLFCLII